MSGIAKGTLLRTNPVYSVGSGREGYNTNARETVYVLIMNSQGHRLAETNQRFSSAVWPHFLRTPIYFSVDAPVDVET